MSFATVRTQIKILLESVDKIGKVHDYKRHTTFWDEFFKRHVKNMQVNTWEISRRALNEEVFAVDNQVSTEPFFHNTHQVTIEGRMALNDDRESEKIFQDLIDAIVVVFRQDPNNLLSGAVILPRQIQVPIIEARTYGGVLCHYCEMNLESIERVGG